MTAKEKILDRVRKLLALSTSSNPHEAAQAAGRAQELLLRHKLAMSEVEIEIDPIDDHEFFDAGKTIPSWIKRLSSAVAKSNQCVVYSTRKSGCTVLRIVGASDAAAAARYMLGYLTHEIDRLAKSATRGQGRTFGNNFRLGAASVIADRLKAMQAEVVAERGETAMIRIGKELARAEAFAASNLRLRSGGRSSYRGNTSGYAAGEAAGRNMSLGGSSGRLAASSKRLRS